MAVTSANELRRRRKGTTDAKETKYTRAWQVKTDDPETQPPEVLAYPTLPSVNDPYPTDANAFCRVVDAVPEGDEADGTTWLVTAQYSSPVTGGWSEDPLLRPVEVYWDFQRDKEEAFYDAVYDLGTPPNLHSHPILNAALEPFDPAPMKDVSRPVLAMVRNEASFSIATASEAQDLVNNADWPDSGGDPAPAGTAKIASITGEKVVEYIGGAAFTYWRVTYRIEFKAIGWRVSLVNWGFRYLGAWELRVEGDPLEGYVRKWYEFKDEDGQPASEPQYLKPDGDKLVFDQPGQVTNEWPAGAPSEAEQIWWIEFQIYNEGSFSALNLPNPYDPTPP